MVIIQARVINEEEDKHIVFKSLQTVAFTAKKPGRYYLNQVIKVNSTSNETNWHCIPPAVIH